MDFRPGEKLGKKTNKKTVEGLYARAVSRQVGDNLLVIITSSVKRKSGAIIGDGDRN